MKWRGSGRRRGRRVLADAGQDRQRIWGRGGERPDAGEKSGKNAALDRPAPSCGIRKNDRDLVSRGTEQGAKDEQEGFRVYESEVALLLHGAFGGRGDGWTGGLARLGQRERRVRPRGEANPTNGRNEADQREKRTRPTDEVGPTNGIRGASQFHGGIGR